MNIDKFDIDSSPFERTLSLRLPATAMVDEEAAAALGEWNSPLVYAEYDRHHLYYDITGRVPLRSHLNRTMTKQEAIALFASVADVLLYAMEKNINPRFIVLDSDLVYVSEETGSLRFVCVPAVNHGLTMKPFRSYIRELIVNMQYDDDENLEYVGKILNYINRNKKMSPDDFMDYLDFLEQDTGDDMLQDPAYASKASAKNEAPMSGPAPGPMPGPMPQEPYANLPAVPFLIRKKTGEKILIDKEEFKIGKLSGMADYLLTDNPAVSRMHAIINKLDGAYYVCDNYSTNCTYLNGEKLESGKNYILLNGARVNFANEEFTFYSEG